MTYCVAMNLADGLIFASDTRTNAGVDHIACFRKMHVFETEGERTLVLLNSGNLATTQSVLSLLRKRTNQDEPHLLNVSSLYDAAALVGATVREVINRDCPQQAQGIDYGCTFVIGGQIKGEAPRLFHIYSQGNFIEATAETPYFQIGESKYGKPILDRVIRYDTDLAEAMKCTLISFDSTIRSNLSVGLPVHILKRKRDDFSAAQPHRLDAEDPYLKAMSHSWGEGLRKVFSQIPAAEWMSDSK